MYFSRRYPVLLSQSSIHNLIRYLNFLFVIYLFYRKVFLAVKQVLPTIVELRYCFPKVVLWIINFVFQQLPLCFLKLFKVFVPFMDCPNCRFYIIQFLHKPGIIFDYLLFINSTNQAYASTFIPFFSGLKVHLFQNAILLVYFANFINKPLIILFSLSLPIELNSGFSLFFHNPAMPSGTLLILFEIYIFLGLHYSLVMGPLMLKMEEYIKLIIMVGGVHLISLLDNININFIICIQQTD